MVSTTFNNKNIVHNVLCIIIYDYNKSHIINNIINKYYYKFLITNNI